MKKIGDVVPVLPVSLMSGVVLANKREWKSELELKSEAAERMTGLERAGAAINIAASAGGRVLSSALGMLEGRGLVEVKDNMYRADEKSIDILNYYSNSIKQWD